MKKYEIKKGQTLEVDGLSIKNIRLQTIPRADADVHQTLVVLFIKPQNKDGKEFSTIIKRVPDEEYQKHLKYFDQTRIISAFGNEITITYANADIGDDVEFTVSKIQ